MRRIKQSGENETIENAREAFERYADQKHKRWNVMRYEQDIDAHLHEVACCIINETFVPSGYTEKWIFDKKRLSPKSRLKTFFLLQRNVYLCTHET